MRALAVNYYQKGYGCSQCVIKAAETKYNLSFDPQAYRMLGIINTGFGVGGLCSVVIASIMVLGLLFDEDNAKRRRMAFLNEFQQKYGKMNCQNLITRRRGNRLCERLISDTMDILERIIEGPY